MRIPDGYHIETIQRGLAQASERMQRVSYQLTSGKRVQRPAEDPVATGIILRSHADLRRCQDQQDVLQKALDHTQAADNPLGEIATALRQVQTLTLQGLNASATSSAADTLATEIEGLAEHIADAANTSVAGRYLLAGTKDGTAPITRDASGVYTYNGNSGTQEFSVAPGRTAPANIPGSRVLNFADGTGGRTVPDVDTDVFTALQDAARELRAGDIEGLRETATQIDALYTNVVEQRGALGSYATRFEAAQQAAGDQEIALKAILANAEDVDIPQAVLDLSSLQTTFQAALTAAGKVAALPTIFDVM
jgi:flagellar hook-associated protein 3 FlgL